MSAQWWIVVCCFGIVTLGFVLQRKRRSWMFVVWFPKEMRHEWWYFACACAFPNNWWLIGAEPKRGAEGLAAIMAPTSFVKMCGWEKTIEKEMVIERLVRNWALKGTEASPWKVWWEWEIEEKGERQLDIWYPQAELQSAFVPHRALLRSFVGWCFSSSVLSNLVPSWLPPSIGTCRKKWELLNLASEPNHLLAEPFSAQQSLSLVGHRQDIGWMGTGLNICITKWPVLFKWQRSPLHEALGNRAPNFEGLAPF